MQINKINNVGFGARLDTSMRNWLFTTRTMDRVDTVELEALMLDNYKDRYIRTSHDDKGITEVRIKPAAFPVIGMDDIVIFEQPKGTGLIEILPQLVENMKKISAERSDWQKQYDEKPY